MEPERRPPQHDRQPEEQPMGFLEGLVTISLRISAMFLVIGAGYYVIEHFGESWFRVYVFATVAACLHFELRRIEREFPDDGD